jgi:hypothetical protein
MSERKPTDALLTTSSFGGGWIIPKTEAAHGPLANFFGGPASFQMPMGEDGWLVEPYMIEDLAEHAKDAGIIIRLDR